jgi:F420-dependent oxidoreductase-like protein
MQICLMIEGQEDVTWEEWESLALACEEHGFDALFRSDHYLSFGHPTDWGNLDAWASLSALAVRTTRIRLGTLVSPVTFRHPAVLAKSVVTVDHVSGGRVELGMGAGWFEAEHQAYGFPFPSSRERVDMLAEQAEIVHRLWSKSEDDVTFERAHYRLDRVRALPKPIQDPHPPLIVGGDGRPGTVQIAARWADEYNVHFKSPEQCSEIRDRLLAGWEAEGRDPSEMRLSLMTGFVTGSNREDLLDRVYRLMDHNGQTGDPAEYYEEMRPGAIKGTPDQVLERLGQYASIGVERVMLQHLVHRDLETLAIVGEQIIPEAADF